MHNVSSIVFLLEDKKHLTAIFIPSLSTAQLPLQPINTLIDGLLGYSKFLADFLVGVYFIKFESEILRIRDFRDHCSGDCPRYQKLHEINREAEEMLKNVIR